MTEFKCINCGEIKDSEKICSCPKCGYRMFELPYERRDKIIEEIKRFISALEVTEIKREDLDFKGKGKDDNRFPDYDKILKYVSSRDRTEDFLNNLLETTEQLKLHFTSEFSKDYSVSFERLENKIASFEPTLYNAEKILSPDKSVEFPKFNWEKVTLLYTECQNKFLWFSANELINLIEKLAKKIVNFIKANNLYGNAHKYYPAKIRFKEKNIDPRCLEFKIIDTMSIEKAQVCHGGVSLKEVDENLQLKKYPGIYVCGEALDVDGDCGGYNLHFAFASGVHVAKSIKK